MEQIDIKRFEFKFSKHNNKHLIIIQINFVQMENM
jgi:hypothetical protein